MNEANLPQPLRDVAELILAHPQVCSKTIKFTEDSQGHVAHFDIAVDLPRDAVDGVSPTGTREVEPVGLRFKDTFPYSAPVIELRNDFNREHPHINPSPSGTPVKPCISEEPLKELLNDPDWIQTIISRLAEWLADSATNQLMELTQGWEPIRRDEFLGSVIIDSKSLIDFARSKGGPGAAYYEYRYLPNFIGHTGVLHHPDKPYYRIKDAPNQRHLCCVDISDPTVYESCALLLWPDKDLIVDCYVPETVTCFDSLVDVAKLYGCHAALVQRVDEIESYLKKEHKDVSAKSDAMVRLLVVLPVQRPVKIIGKESPYELITYVLKIPVDTSYTLMRNKSEVKPVAQIEAVSNKLLRELSGRSPEPDDDGKQHVTVVGCGSVGSKIALHLARSGVESFDLIDSSLFRPHNNARHALVELGGLPRYKAHALGKAIERLGAKVLTCQHRDAAQIPAEQWKKLAQRSNVIIDATASSSVREFLCNMPAADTSAQLTRCELYDKGSLSVTYIEDRNKNPGLEDLTARFYQLALENDDTGKHVYRSKAMQEVRVGDSCSSYTMPMNDATISAHAADMANIMLQLLDTPESTGGEIIIGKRSESGLGTTYENISVPRAITCKTSINGTDWEVRIPEDITVQMAALSAENAPKEYGGVLIGQVLWARRKLIVTSILPPPPDSTFSNTEFTLGTKGLKNNLRKITRASGGTLNYIGTWHSHPQGGSASQTDKHTLQQLSKDRAPAPTVCLIYKPNGLEAVTL